VILNKDCYERGCAAYDDRVDEGVVLTNGGEHMKAFPSTDDTTHDRGMDLRDYFAAKAMQALIGREDFEFEDHTWETAYDVADAMMKAREQRD
jgi:hypothetical protein